MMQLSYHPDGDMFSTIRRCWSSSRRSMCRWSSALGFDLIWYGVLYTITCQIAYMTPPFGYNLFLMRAMAPNEESLAGRHLPVDRRRSCW